MKKILIILALAFSFNLGNAQEIIKLQETKLNYHPEPLDFTSNGNSFIIKIREIAAGEFEKNPLAFMQTQFNINALLDKIEYKKYTSYHVSFRTRKGELQAEYNNRGELLSTSGKFKNVIIPSDLKHQLYRDYKGWALIKTLHLAKGKNGIIETDQYVLKMQKGNKRINVKVNREDISVKA